MRRRCLTDQQLGVALPDFVRRCAFETPTKVAIVGPKRAISYADLYLASTHVAAGLRAHGAVPGDRVGYLGHNSPEFFEIWMGANEAGCALVPFNWRSSHHELAGLITAARPVILFVGDEFSGPARRALESLPVQPVIVALSDLPAWLADAPSGNPGPVAEVGAIALLAYTSGTTGAPKGVPITNGAFLEWFAAAAEEPAAAWSSTDVGLMVMPNFHLAGTWVSIPALVSGATLVVLPSFEPEQFLAAISDHRVTLTCLVPTALQALVPHLPAYRGELSSLRRITYAGSPIGAETLTALIDNLDCDLVQFYGTTETFIISLLRPEQHRAGDAAALSSCGTPMPPVRIRLVDPDGREVPEGEPGEVLVHSPWMFAGYWQGPEATAEALIDGWYHTGDVGLVDPAGNLHLVDRIKDMIVSGGENVYSAEVERALGSHPGVLAAAVVGMPDEKWGERVVGFVVPAAGSKVEPAELTAHCRERIAGYKVPKEIHLVESLPLTASGKVQKASLRERFTKASQ